MTIRGFKRSKEGKALLRMLKNYNDEADKWTAGEWKSRCVEYAVIINAIELFLDVDYNTLDIPNTATAQSVWDSAQWWWRQNEYATEILGSGDARWSAFENAFEFIDPTKED